jgi:hypothetical protein
MLKGKPAPRKGASFFALVLDLYKGTPLSWIGSDQARGIAGRTGDLT